jgi:hypothetical protein
MVRAVLRGAASMIPEHSASGVSFDFQGVRMLGKKLLICIAGAVFALATIPGISQASVTAPLSGRLGHATLTTSAKHTKLVKGKKGKGGKHHKHKGKKGKKKA